ncbi:MAG: hypothetical protein HZY75_06975 [Nocardioidaceae bacterium]|nr:MAG: hypothetical protein HZY75_06975 [Nocardioidaceae bacterium]
MTATLHIEHAITDYPTWKAAFDRFGNARAQAGVTTHRIRLLENDLHQIVIDLEFATPELARAFLDFLHEKVWRTGNAPALVGTLKTAVLIEAPA